MIKIIKIMVIRVEGISMSLIQVQQLSRHPTDYGAEILVQVMMMKMMIMMMLISTMMMISTMSMISTMMMISMMMMSMTMQDDHVFATSRGTGILVVYKIGVSGKLSRSMIMIMIL